MDNEYYIDKQLLKEGFSVSLVHFILFGFMKILASHLERSPLIHSYRYASADDHPTCIARLSINSKSVMQFAGEPCTMNS